MGLHKLWSVCSSAHVEYKMPRRAQRMGRGWGRRTAAAAHRGHNGLSYYCAECWMGQNHHRTCVLCDTNVLATFTKHMQILIILFARCTQMAHFYFVDTKRAKKERIYENPIPSLVEMFWMYSLESFPSPASIYTDAARYSPPTVREGHPQPDKQRRSLHRGRGHLEASSRDLWGLRGLWASVGGVLLVVGSPINMQPAHNTFCRDIFVTGCRLIPMLLEFLLWATMGSSILIYFPCISKSITFPLQVGLSST